MPRMLTALAAIVSLCACGGAAVESSDRESSAVMQATPDGTTIDVFVFSGRPQPPPETVSASVGASITLRLSGLGPPHATVTGPNGGRISTTDRPPTRDNPAEQRFELPSRGTYDVVLDASGGLVLVRIEAS